MSIIESLISNVTENVTDNSKTVKTSKKGSFLTDLLKTYKDEPEKLSTVFKSLNLNEQDLDKLSLQNSTDKDLKKLINDLKLSLKEGDSENLNKFSKLNFKDSEEELNKKITNSLKAENTESEILKKLINETPVSNKELQDKLNTLLKNIKTDDKSKKDIPENEITDILNINNLNTLSSGGKSDAEEKIVNFTKKIITSKQNIEQLKLSDSDVKEFKEIKTFNELISFANKKELNISKIIISYENSSLNEKQKFLPKNKIELSENLKKDLKFNTKKNISNKPENILSSLIQKEAGKNDTVKTGIDNGKYQLNENENRHTKTKPDSTAAHTQNAGFNVNELKQNIYKAKQSIKHFSSNLKEAIDNYKPPVSKLSMELHPKELGKVEVTLIHRGDNLQIQINSNNTAVGFLHSQQQELRQNLINMGFTDVNMSFNQQQNKGNQEYRQNHKFKNSGEESDELIIEIPYQYA